MRVAGILIFLCFYGTYFVKLLAQRKKGIQTDRVGKGSKPKRTFLIEILLKTLTIVLALVQLISIFLPAGKGFFAQSLVRGIGIVVSMIGVLIFLCAVLTMRDSWRAGVDREQKTELVSDGIYRFSRNPAFLGFDLFYIGFVLSFFNFVHLLSTIGCIVLFHLQILEEERFLHQMFSTRYDQYCRRTSRYLGWKRTH